MMRSDPQRHLPQRIAYVLVAVFLTLALCSAHAQLMDDYRFVGRVVDRSGKPIPGVHISLRESETGARISFTTHDDGTFDHRMIPHALYDATFEKPGYVTRTDHLDWSASPEATKTVEATIVLENQSDKAKAELGKKAAELYDQSYAALAANDCAKASESARKLLEMGAGSYEYAVRFILARCHAMKEEFPQAVTEYQKVLALKPDFFEARFDLALILEKEGQHEAALKEFEAAVALRPDDVEAQYNMGAILLLKKDYEGARPHLETAASLDSTHAMAAKALGFACLQGEHKDLEAARRHLERYLVLKPDAPDAEQIRGIVAELKTSTP